MMGTAPLAVLSYTRKDDEFYGGYISAFRKALENSVHVASGATSFRVFQDVEGIVIGEKWKRRLSEVIHRSSFLIPVLTPLYFNSDACRAEMKEFLAHEKKLGRDDLVLPIYLLDTPTLEDPAKTAEDDLALEVRKRQFFDWRKRTSVSLAAARARPWLMDLAKQIVKRIDALAGGPEGPRRGGRPKTSPDRSDPRIARGVARGSVLVQPKGMKMLWVDDKPENNRLERRALESYGIRFTVARSTEEAKRLVAGKGRFAGIISDLSRPGDAKAGLTLLEEIRGEAPSTPYFVYTGKVGASLEREAHRKGVEGITANPDALVRMVVGKLR